MWARAGLPGNRPFSWQTGCPIADPSGAVRLSRVVSRHQRWHALGMVHLLPATDDHFAWLLSEAGAPSGLREPEGGVDDPVVLKILRRLTAKLHAAGCQASWLIVDQDEVVGLCSFKRPADAAHSAEIGYGVAESCRRKGYATLAVDLLIKEVVDTKAASRLLAETVNSNLESQRVLERNGFSIDGTRHDAEDGDLIIWSRSLVT
jgi:ribosomal protein S18 acetylase RimI-like enzyme